MELFIGLFLLLAVIVMAIVLWRGEPSGQSHEPSREPHEEHEDTSEEQFDDNQN